MRVAVFRAADDGARTAARLAAFGHEAVLTPVIAIASTGAPIPDGPFEGVIFTSAHAPAALHATALSRLTDLPCWCVGTRTAAAAAAAGFARIHTGPGDAAGLVDALRTADSGHRLLFVTGHDRRRVLEDALLRAGVTLDVVEAYRAEAVAAWPPGTVTQLATVTAALHYSRRSATLAFTFLETAGLAATARQWRHGCLSEDIAAGVRQCGMTDVTTAIHPDEESLVATLVGSRADSISVESEDDSARR